MEAEIEVKAVFPPSTQLGYLLTLVFALFISDKGVRVLDCLRLPSVDNADPKCRCFWGDKRSCLLFFDIGPYVLAPWLRPFLLMHKPGQGFVLF